MPNKESDNESFDERLKAALKENRMVQDTSTDDDNVAMGYGRVMQLGIELFSAVAVGTGIGYFLDKWLETAPMFLIVFFFLGVAAGFINLYRFVKNLGYDIGYKSDKDSADK